MLPAVLGLFHITSFPVICLFCAERRPAGRNQFQMPVMACLELVSYYWAIKASTPPPRNQEKLGKE